jgi:hypothetical protein
MDEARPALEWMSIEKTQCRIAALLLDLFVRTLEAKT